MRFALRLGQRIEPKSGHHFSGKFDAPTKR
jgi:hypothetical protein